MSDQQGPHVYLFSKACQRSGREDLARSALTSVFQNFISVAGAIARLDLEPAKAFDYVIARAMGKPEFDVSAIARPSQTLASLMICGSSLALDEGWDQLLISLDHKTTNIFLPDSYLDFGSEVIYQGVNYTFTIGHDVWTLADFKSLFDQNCKSNLEANPTGQLPEVRALAILSSYLFPNRVPYLLECV